VPPTVNAHACAMARTLLQTTIPPTLFVNRVRYDRPHDPATLLAPAEHAARARG
jgi:hypothetical protein